MKSNDLKNMQKPIVLLAVVATLSACSAVGPSSISSNRPAYNLAVQQTNDQELLLNLVRILYRDTLYFTSVERIAASQEFNQGLSASALIASTSNAYVVPPVAPGNAISNFLTRSLTFGPASVALNEKPTVFYAPLEGEKFVRQMMTPMNPDLLLMLVKSGWSLDRVFSVGVQELNGLKNAPTATGPTPSREPEFRDFREVVKLLRALQREQLIELAKAAGNDGGIELRFVRNANQRAETGKLRSMLGLAPGRDRFRIVSGVEAPNPETIAVSTRPLIAALGYVAQGIEAPAEDIKAGKVRRTLRSDGSTPFDWQEMLDGVFRVRSAKEAPESASVSVLYRGSHFYIPDDDLESKSTFVLLTQLMALHSTPASAGPAVSFSFGK